MSPHHISTALTAGVLYLLPLAFEPQRLLHPAPWLGFLAAWVTLGSQPPLSLRGMLASTGPDRGSALLIFVAMIGVQLVAVIDFGYRVGAPWHAVTGGAPGGSRLVIGAALVAAGLALRLTAIRTLGRWFTSVVHVGDGQRVVRHGVYRLIRHPSYTGALIVATGVACALGSAWGLALIPLLALPAYLYRISAEERALVAALGGEYERYRSDTWRLIPFVI